MLFLTTIILNIISKQTSCQFRSGKCKMLLAGYQPCKRFYNVMSAGRCFRTMPKTKILFQTGICTDVFVNTTSARTSIRGPRVTETKLQGKRNPKHHSTMFTSLAISHAVKIEIHHEDSNEREVGSFLDCKDQNHFLLSSKNTTRGKKFPIC